MVCSLHLFDVLDHHNSSSTLVRNPPISVFLYVYSHECRDLVLVKWAVHSDRYCDLSLLLRITGLGSPFSTLA